MKNVIFGMVVLIALQMVIGCNGVKSDKKEVIVENHPQTQPVLDNDYNAWFEQPGEYVETYRLKIDEVRVGKYAYQTEKLIVAFVENLTENLKGGFLLAPSSSDDVYLPFDALNELIGTLEDVVKQMQSGGCVYNCNRQYITSFGINIVFHYSSTAQKWDTIKIYYTNRGQEIESEYLQEYINGLKKCKQSIEEFKAGKWDNKL